MGKQNVPLFDLSWEHSHQVTQICHHSAHVGSEHDRESAMSIDLEATTKFQQVGKYANMESANNEDSLCIYVVLNVVYLLVHMYVYKCFPYKMKSILNI